MGIPEIIEKKSKTEPYQKLKYVWVLPVLAIGLFDASAAMLTIMFVAPPVAILLIGVSRIINKYFQVKVQLHIASFVTALLITCAILYWGSVSFSQEKMFESVIASPIPESVEILEKGGQLTAMGIASFYIVFNISNEDLNLIISENELSRKNILAISGKSPELYKRALNEAQEWLNDRSAIYVKDDDISSYRCSILITNKAHDKVYYRIF